MNLCAVNVPVTDLRREPSPHNQKYEKDPLQESQLLYGELVIVDEEKEGWSHVAAVEQQKYFSTGAWGAYPGWIKTSDLFSVKTSLEDAQKYHAVISTLLANVYSGATLKSPVIQALSLGTRLKIVAREGDWLITSLADGSVGAIQSSQATTIEEMQASSPKDKMNKMITLGQTLLGAPYLWGGRSAYLEGLSPLTSIDCSGFVNLLYRTVHGIDLPRDSHDQYLKCKKIEGHELDVGDLVFMASKAKPEQMHHVMIYAGGGFLIEATAASRSVRRIAVKDRFGELHHNVAAGSVVGECVVYYGAVQLP